MYNNVLQPPYYYKVGLYIRLSQEDKDKDKKYESESESIINQRNLLHRYVEDNGFTLIDEYVDDGFTGTNFDRPGFQRMIEDIESGRINCVITKDLSRLGRDYIQCGYYIEQYFPQKKVRYISILDQVDTFNESANNDIAPFKALFNDITSKDTSKKIRSILRDKKQQGKFIGSLPCYGYMRDPEDKGHLIPNPETAPIVKNIFRWKYSGIGVSEITTMLDEMKAPTPSKYKGTKYSSRQINNDHWNISSVKKILSNRMYIGDMVQNVQTKISYKSKKKIALDKSFWIIKENTHEPLVDKETFYTILNSKPKRIRNTDTGREKRLLENLIFCKECGNTLTVTYRKNHDYWTVNCNRYSRDPKRGFCEPHFFPYDYLEEQILKRVKATLKKYLSQIDMDKLSSEVVKLAFYQNDAENEKAMFKKKIKEFEKKIDNLYDDKTNGIVSTETYIRKQEEYEKNIKEIKNKMNQLKYEEIARDSFKKKLPEYEKVLKELINADNPSRELLIAIIERIEIDKDRNIEINYRFNIIEPTKFAYKKV